jgi:chitosanase
VVGPTAPGLDGERRRRADQLISAFENSTTVIQYDYAEDIGDGRGITSGRAGFTTADCDARDVIERYASTAPGNVLVRFLRELGRLCDAGSADTTGLPAADYIRAWRQAANDPAFRAAQDAVVNTAYFGPAMAAADALGLRTPLARAELYDTAIEEGTDNDHDGLGAVVARTNGQAGSPATIGEAAWLDHFFSERIATLAQNQAWADTTDRVECMRRLARAGQSNLDGPIHFTVYGDDFTIP